MTEGSIIYENEISKVIEVEIERRPHGVTSIYLVMHKTMPSIIKRFDEQKLSNAKKDAINFCDSYIRQIVE